MEKLNFETYFKDSNRKYYDSKYIITILESILGKKLDEIKKEVKNAKVSVTKEEITEFLEKRFEEDPKLKKRIESSRPKRSNNIGKWTDEDIENASQEFGDELSAGRYYFEPYTLKYFNKYSNIVRKKALQLLNIIEKIGNKNVSSAQDFIVDLDIQIDEKGNIKKEDIIRLITPTVYNIKVLNEKILKANDLSTYLTFKESKHSLLRDDISEGEIYPSSSLQIKNLYYDHVRGNVPLSSNQITELRKVQSRSMKKGAKILIDM